MILMATFQERIKELRIEMGLTQEGLSAAIKVARPTIAAWEATGAEPSYEVLISLARFFGVSTDYLLGISDERRIVITPDEISEIFPRSAKKMKEAGIIEIGWDEDDLTDENLMKFIQYAIAKRNRQKDRK